MDKSLHAMISNLEKKTGKKFEIWVQLVKSSGHIKHGDMLDFLMSGHGLTHGYANLIAMKAREKESGFAAPAETLVSKHYLGKELLYSMYEMLIAAVSKFGNDEAISPKKTYVSLRRKKQFALVQPSTVTRMDIGINLKDTPFSDRLEKPGSFNSMCSHRVRIAKIDQIDQGLLDWIKAAYDQA